MTISAAGDTFIVDDDGGSWADYTSIQDALDASADGDTVLVYEGVYYENLWINNSVTLNGNGTDASLIDGQGIWNAIRITKPSTVSNLAITTGNMDEFCGIHMMTDSCTISNNLFYNCWKGSRTVFSSHSYIDNVFRNCNRTGIEVDETYGVSITGNMFENITEKGLRIVDSNTIKTSGNEFRNCLLWGISFENSESSHVRMSTFQDMSNGAIGLDGSEDIEISGCDFTGMESRCIRLGNSTGIEISNNSISSCGRHGIMIRHSSGITINGNVIRECHKNGIYLSGTNYNNVITDNSCSFNDWSGVAIEGSGQNRIENNTFSHNLGHGIQLFDGSGHNEVRSNLISNNAGHGMMILGGSESMYCKNNSFLANQVWDNGNGSGRQGYDDSPDNIWDDGWEGNFWSDATGEDKDNDRVFDVPYEIEGSAGSQDRFPYSRPNATRRIINHQPSGFIQFPQRTVVETNSTLILSANATDIDGSVALYSWSSSGDGEFYNGTNSTVEAGPFPDGVTTISLRVMDNGSLWSEPDAIIIWGGSDLNTWSVAEEPGRGVDFTTITEALEWVQPGDTIRLYSGNYTDLLTINSSISIVGNGSGSTVLYIPNGSCLEILSENVTISDLHVLGHADSEGAVVDNLGNITIRNCTFTGHYRGIRTIYAWDITIVGCRVLNSTGSGILLTFSNNITIEDSVVRGSQRNGLSIRYSQMVDVDGSRFINNREYGIKIESSDMGQLTKCTVFNSTDFAIWVNKHSYMNHITGNTLIANGNGTQKQAFDGSAENYWDRYLSGNFWSDYSGSDLDGDGTGEKAYNIDGAQDSKDHHPVMEPNGSRIPMTWIVDDDWIGADFDTIEDALKSSGPDDVVRVHDGTYYEKIKVPAGVEIIGNGTYTTTIDARYEGDTVIRFKEPGAKISGVSLTGDLLSTGIELTTDDCSIMDCHFDGRDGRGLKYGISIVRGNGNHIFNNSFNVSHPIELEDSTENIIDGNHISGSSTGIHIDNRVTIPFYRNMQPSPNHERYSATTGRNRMSNNTIESRIHGIHIEFSHREEIAGNTIINGSSGIHIFASSYATVSSNVIKGCNVNGLLIDGYSSPNYRLTGTYYDEGLKAHVHLTIYGQQDYVAASDTDVYSNSFVVDIGHGIQIKGHSHWNTVHHNTFRGNTTDSYAVNYGNCTFDDGSEGNYWANYNGTDDDGDGIGEEPYTRGRKIYDRYPFTDKRSDPEDPTGEDPIGEDPIGEDPDPSPTEPDSEGESRDEAFLPTEVLGAISLIVLLVVLVAILLTRKKKDPPSRREAPARPTNRTALYHDGIEKPERYRRPPPRDVGPFDTSGWGEREPRRSQRIPKATFEEPVRRTPVREAPPSRKSKAPERRCPDCGSPIRFDKKYDSWACDECRKLVDP